MHRHALTHFQICVRSLRCLRYKLNRPNPTLRFLCAPNSAASTSTLHASTCVQFCNLGLFVRGTGLQGLLPKRGSWAVNVRQGPSLLIRIYQQDPGSDVTGHLEKGAGAFHCSSREMWLLLLKLKTKR
ncbi:hypothetical protein ACLB2K_041445 [Fragaria x ananassa]